MTHHRQTAYVVVKIRQKRTKYYEKTYYLTHHPHKCPPQYHHQQAAEVHAGTLDFALFGEKLEYSADADEEVEA